MKYASSIFRSLCVLLVVISLATSFIGIQAIAAGLNQINDTEPIAIKSQKDLTVEETSSVGASSISITHPIPGHLYTLNTQGVSNAVLGLLNCALVLDSSLEVGAEPAGDIDEVEFILTTSKFGREIERKTDDSVEQGKFSCTFNQITSFFGNYEITAVAYYQSQEVARDSVEKIIFLKVGSSSGNKAPIAVAKFSSYSWEGKEVEFDASESYDPDGGFLSYHWDFGDGHTSDEMNPTHTFNSPGSFPITLTVTDDEGATGTDGGTVRIIDYDFGVWLVSDYNGATDEEKLDIGIDEFVWMLHYGGGWRTYQLSMEEEDDTVVTFRFGKTIISGINAIMTQFRVEVAGDTDLSKEFEVGLEFRFPYSLLNQDQPPTDDYFAARLGYSYAGGSSSQQGPHGVESFFYFGKESFSDPGILRMSINPYYGSYTGTFPLTYSTSFITVDGNDVQQFRRDLSVEFDPAAHLTIDTVPREAKVSYAFGDETAWQTTTISFFAQGGQFSDIIHRFILDPLPSDMSFDLTILGERSFKYAASQSYSFTYIMDSQQNGEMVKLELKNMPKTATVSWGLNINLLAKTGSGFIDLDMSSSVREAKLFLQGNSKPFIEMTNLPAKFRVSASLNVPSLSGIVSISKYSGSTTTISVPVVFDKWEITASLNIYDGAATASFNLPDSSSDRISVGLDTNNKEMFGFDVSLVDTQSSKEVLHASLGGMATQDFQVAFDNVDGQVENFGLSGQVTKLTDLNIEVDYQGFNFDIAGTWSLGQQGSFMITVNKLVDLSFDNIELSGIILNGGVTLNPGASIYVEWVRGDVGHFVIDTEGIVADIDLTFGSLGSGNLYIHGNLELNPDIYIKFDWEWGEIGHFYVFMPNPVGEYLELDVRYDPSQSGNWQYGFKITATDFLDITRQIQWDSANRVLTRVWILGDNPLPGEWTLQLLWNYQWYPVPYEP